MASEDPDFVFHEVGRVTTSGLGTGSLFVFQRGTEVLFENHARSIRVLKFFFLWECPFPHPLPVLSSWLTLL